MMNTSEALKLAKQELESAKAKLINSEREAAHWKACYEQMRGQVVSQTECANSLRMADTAAWEAHFSRRAKKLRKLSGGHPHDFKIPKDLCPATPA